MNEIRHSLQSDCQNATYIQYKYNVRSQGVPMIKLSDSKVQLLAEIYLIFVYEVTIWRINNNLVVPQPKYYSSVLMNGPGSCRTVSLKVSKCPDERVKISRPNSEFTQLLAA